MTSEVAGLIAQTIRADIATCSIQPGYITVESAEKEPIAGRFRALGGFSGLGHYGLMASAKKMNIAPPPATGANGRLSDCLKVRP